MRSDINLDQEVTSGLPETLGTKNSRVLGNMMARSGHNDQGLLTSTLGQLGGEREERPVCLLQAKNDCSHFGSCVLVFNVPRNWVSAMK